MPVLKDCLKKIGFAFLFAAMMSGTALAQCPMCKAAIEGSPDAASAASGINLAVLVLLLPPVAIFGGVFVFVYKQRNAPN